MRRARYRRARLAFRADAARTLRGMGKSNRGDRARDDRRKVARERKQERRDVPPRRERAIDPRADRRERR